MTDKNIDFSDSEDEDDNSIEIETQKIVITLKKLKGNKEGTYLTGIPAIDGKEVKDVLSELKKEFIKNNSTGCSIKMNSEKKSLSFLPPGYYLFLQGSHDIKLHDFLVEKGYTDIIVKN